MIKPENEENTEKSKLEKIKELKQVDNGKLSTKVISGAMIVFSAILLEPNLVQPLTGDYHNKFLSIVPLLIVLYNAYYPRPINKKE